MDSRLLHCFLLVAEKGTFTAAAEAAHLTQPALSRSVQQLEQILGVELFERLPGGVKLTRFGEVLVRRAKLIQQEISQARVEIETMRKGSAGAITIGAGPFSSIIYLPQAVAAVQRLKPDLKVTIVSSVLDDLVPQLLEGKTDLFCAALDFPDHPDVIKEFLMDVRHVVVARPGHPLAQKSRVNPSDLLDYSWAALTGDYIWRARMGTYFAANGLQQPNVNLEANTVDALLGVIMTTNALTSVSAPLHRRAGYGHLAEIQIKGSFWQFRVGLAYRKGALQNPSVSAFVSEMKALATAEEPLLAEAT